jgi:septal ring factor EnvC (AmiA/AmiB activator)
MNWKHTLIIVVSILFLGVILGYMMKSNHIENYANQKKIIEQERKTIDSLFKEISNIKKEREVMEVQLNVLTSDIKKSESNLSIKINQLKIQNNVKIDSILNSSNDELLIQLRKRFGAN